MNINPTYNIAPSVASPQPSLRSHKAFKEYAKAKEAFKKAWRGAEGSPPSLRERLQSTTDPGFIGWKTFYRTLFETYDDSDFMMIFFELLYAVPARGTRWIGMVLKVTGATADVISSLGVVLGFVSIFYLYHTSRDAYKKLKMAATAFKCGEFAAGFHFVLGGSSRATFAGAIAAKSIKQAFVWAGMGANSTVKFIFAYATPLAFLVGSTMSGVRKIWEMSRTIKAYRNFKNHVIKRKDKGKGLVGVIKTLEEELNAPKNIYADSYGFDSDEKYKSKFIDNDGKFVKGKFIYEECVKKTFIDRRYTSTNRYEGLRDDSIALRLFMVQEMRKSLAEPIEKLRSSDAGGLFDRELKLYDKLTDLQAELYYGSEHAIISDSLEIYGIVMNQLADPRSLVAQFAEVDPEKAKTILDNLETAKTALMEHAEYIQDRVTSEMHRRIVYNSIQLTMSVLMIVGNILIIIGAPHILLIGTILTFSSAVIDTPYLIFNKIDREAGFRKVEQLLSKIKLFRSQKSEPLLPLPGRALPLY